MWPRFSPDAFLAVFCCTYAVAFAGSCPLFLYYPLHGEFQWGHQLVAGRGPAMAWYGLIADAALVASAASVCVPASRSGTLFRRYVTLFPLGAMLVAVFLLRHLFL